MSLLARILIAQDAFGDERRKLFITEGWPETAWRNECDRIAFKPLYIVNIRRKV